MANFTVKLPRQGIHCINVLNMSDMIRERTFQNIDDISIMIYQCYQNYDIQPDGMTIVSILPVHIKSITVHCGHYLMII